MSKFDDSYGWRMRTPWTIEAFNIRAERLLYIFNSFTHEYYNDIVLLISEKEWKYLEYKYKKCESRILEIDRKKYPNQRDLNYLEKILKDLIIPTIEKLLEHKILVYEGIKVKEVWYDYSASMIMLDHQELYYLGYVQIKD